MPWIDIEELRRRIVAQADAADPDGWMEFEVPAIVRPSGTLRVPRGAFEHWAVHQHGGGHLAAPWTVVSPSGLKQGDDDPNHTDWMLGAGLSPRDMHHSNRVPSAEALSSAAFRALLEVQDRLLGFKCAVLVPGPEVQGRAVHAAKPGEANWDDAWDAPPVLVLRDASPDWLPDVIEAFRRGGAVVVERGGGVSHLIVEARAQSRGAVVRVPDARAAFPAGHRVFLSAGTGQVRLADQEAALVPRNSETYVYGEENRPKPVPARVAAPPAARSGFGFALRQPGRELPGSGMMAALSIKGRDANAYASWHFNGWETDFLRVPAWLVVHVSRKDRSAPTRTMVSQPRCWKAGDAIRATREAFYALDPAEHPNSPETAAARQHCQDAEHGFWMRTSKHADSTNEELVSSALALVADEAEYRANQDPETSNSDYLDDLSSYRYSREHFDEEFRRRGMTETVFDLEIGVTRTGMAP